MKNHLRTNSDLNFNNIINELKQNQTQQNNDLRDSYLESLHTQQNTIVSRPQSTKNQSQLQASSQNDYQINAQNNLLNNQTVFNQSLNPNKNQLAPQQFKENLQDQKVLHSQNNSNKNKRSESMNLQQIFIQQQSDLNSLKNRNNHNYQPNIQIQNQDRIKEPQQDKDIQIMKNSYKDQNQHYEQPLNQGNQDYNDIHQNRKTQKIDNSHHHHQKSYDFSNFNLQPSNNLNFNNNDLYQQKQSLNKKSFLSTQPISSQYLNSNSDNNNNNSKLDAQMNIIKQAKISILDDIDQQGLLQKEIVFQDDTSNTEVLKERISKLQDQIKTKQSILLKMKNFQEDFCNIVEKANREFNQQITDLKNKNDEKDQFLQQIQNKCSDLEQENTNLLVKLKNQEGNLGTSYIQKQQDTFLKQQQQMFSQFNYQPQNNTNPISDPKYQQEIQNYQRIIESKENEINSLTRKLKISTNSNTNFANTNTSLADISQLVGLENKQINLSSNQSGLLQNDTQTNINNTTQQEKKFIESIKSMIINCAPDGYFKNQDPSLRSIWKWLKQIMNDFLKLKSQNNVYSQILKSIQKKFNLESQEEICNKIDQIGVEQQTFNRIIQLLKNYLNISNEFDLFTIERQFIKFVDRKLQNE